MLRYAYFSTACIVSKLCVVGEWHIDREIAVVGNVTSSVSQLSWAVEPCLIWSSCGALGTPIGYERMLGYMAADVLNKITPTAISYPQEVIVRANALSVELKTPITPDFESLVFKASCDIEDIYELTCTRKDGSRFPTVVPVTALRAGHHHRLPVDRHCQYCAETDRRRAEEARSAPARPAVLHAIMTTDPSRIISDINKQMEALSGCTRDEQTGAPFKNDFTDPGRDELAGSFLYLTKPIKVNEFMNALDDALKLSEIGLVNTNKMDKYDD